MYLNNFPSTQNTFQWIVGGEKKQTAIFQMINHRQHQKLSGGEIEREILVLLSNALIKINRPQTNYSNWMLNNRWCDTDFFIFCDACYFVIVSMWRDGFIEILSPALIEIFAWFDFIQIWNFFRITLICATDCMF